MNGCQAGQVSTYRWFLLLVALTAPLASSQSVYQCQSRDGSLVFQDSPCPEGETLAIRRETNANSGDSSGEYSMWVGPNFVDTAYSVLLAGTAVEEVPADDPMQRHIPYEWQPVRVRASVLESYRGDLAPGNSLELLVYLSLLNPPEYQREQLRDRFLASFCRSNSGIYYTSRDFLIMRATRNNVAEFRRIKAEGTDYEGAGDCSGTNYPALNPDTHQ